MNSETLEGYLAGDYHRDIEDIRHLEATLASIQDLFIHSCKDGHWPYDRRARKDAEFDNVSHGTQAMIAAAVGKMTGQCTMPSGDRARLEFKLDARLSESQKAGVRCLIESVVEGALRSGTFGRNDPVTLSHVVELARGLAGANAGALAKDLLDKVQAALNALTSVISRDPANPSSCLLPHLPTFASVPEEIRDASVASPSGRQPDYVLNAFVPLRVVRSLCGMEKAAAAVKEIVNPLPSISEQSLNAYRNYFESTLYDQLSFSAIPDSRFDAAELIFCLEGLLLSSPQAVDERIFEHVLSVLRDKQELSTQWRPNRPILATPQGMTMLPVSVESAVSLVRSIEIMDRHRTHHRFSSLGVSVARRFWHWLRAHQVNFFAPSTREEGQIELVGWHSEHVNDPGVIHLWDTSQVIEFMLGYRELLQRNVAGRSLLLSRLKVVRPQREKPANWQAVWETKAEIFEPRPSGKQRVYIDRLTKDFIEPWGRGEPSNYSMLLYGPPGTGKSSLAANIADTLGMAMITVTVSDFLGHGGANVEARAKAIFQTLEAQLDTVILFDEIDSFLLDRDTKRYREQDSLFQFLTPGMLTKINDLRNRRRSIFIIATNYANRIDPAIKRKGRIDQQYLLSLPSGAKRLAIIDSLRGNPVEGKDEARVKDETLFFGFSDLKGLVDAAGGKKGDDASLLRSLAGGDFKPATNIETYLARYPEENFPFDELADLAQLKAEVSPGYKLQDIRLQSANSAIRRQFANELNGWISRTTPPPKPTNKGAQIKKVKRRKSPGQEARR